MTDSNRFQQAMLLIDRANEADPNTEEVQGVSFPRELLYAQRMSARLREFAPEASEILQLAARAQHIQRWHIPRSRYPEGRQGYKRWRTELAKFHADTAGAILAKAGYDAASVECIKNLLQKKQLKRDPEVQTLEDVICLVFIEHYLADFANKHSEEKLIDIIRKTWNKMSTAGHNAALELPLPEKLAKLIGKALG